MLSCYKYRHRLGAYLDGELPINRSQKVAAHLAKCPKCQTVAEEYRSLEEMLLSNQIPAPAFDLTERILTKARQQLPVKGEGSHRFGLFLSSGQRSWTLKFASIVVGISTGIFLGKDIGRINNFFVSSRVVVMENTYHMDVFGATPKGSIEAAAINLLRE